MIRLVKNKEQLRNSIVTMDRKPYGHYKGLAGRYDFGSYQLGIDYVQGDPFASPSKVHILVPGDKAGFPKSLFETKEKRIALQDCLTRQMGKLIGRGTKEGSGKSGLVSISRCGQQILERTAMKLDAPSGLVQARIEVGFPAYGRSINAQGLIKILFEFLPVVVSKGLIYKNLDKRMLDKVAQLAEDQQALREEMKAMGLVAFVANGSILPRESGISDRPMKGAVVFKSPESMKVSVNLPNRGLVPGMGIKGGVAVIAGGGYHGKSTLLQALEKGVYNHIEGDGRELVMTESSAMKIRSEDSRYVSNVDISMFLNDLPRPPKGGQGKSTKAFSTEDASGSTSQATNIIEALESGSKVLLFDEDTSAVNLMIRDELMQRVVRGNDEPITPYISRARQLWQESGISSILVIGSSGAYFHIADKIIQMKEYEPIDITEKAINLAKEFPELHTDGLPYASPEGIRKLRAAGLLGKDRVKVKTNGMNGVSINRNEIDLRHCEQLVDVEQLAALGWILVYFAKRNKGQSLQAVVDLAEEMIESEGMESLIGDVVPNMAMPRRQEIFACFNRCRQIGFDLEN